MPFNKDDPESMKFRKNGRDVGSKNKTTATKQKFIELFTEEYLHEQIKKDFVTDPTIKKFVYEHVFDKPVNRNENDNSNTFPEGISINFTKPELKETHG